MKEKRRLVGSTNAATYFDLGNLDLSLGGRFAPGGDKSGADHSVNYPRQPDGSPWARDDTGVEPPLGYEIDSLEAVGGPSEDAASLDHSPGDAAGASSSDSADIGS